MSTTNKLINSILANDDENKGNNRNLYNLLHLAQVFSSFPPGREANMKEKTLDTHDINNEHRKISK